MLLLLVVEVEQVIQLDQGDRQVVAAVPVVL